MTKALESRPVSCVVFRKLPSPGHWPVIPIATPIQEDWEEHLDLTLVPQIRIIAMVLKNQTSTMKDPKSVARCLDFLLADGSGEREREESKPLVLKSPFSSQ